MAWTTAPTFTAGTAPTATSLNILRDDLNLIGGAWSTYTPVLSGTGWAAGTSTITGRYKLIGDKVVRVQIKCTFAGATFGTGNLLFSLPTAAMQETAGLFPLGEGLVIDASPTNRYVCQVQVNDSTHVQLYTAAQPGGGVTSTVPITFANGDSVYLHFDYELA